MSDIGAIRAGLAGRYIIERELGRGGMSTVYLARDLKHGRHVALKVLNAALNDSAGNERFLREIRTTARLTHPGILPLHDSGEVAGVPFYTMPWVDGETLRDLLDREGALPVERAVAIAASVADALAYAHESGVTHRDIKPENILIARSGHLWVSDFGLAHALAGAVNARLSAGVALGSVHYMSPEQALGKEAGPPSDVYSLGCVLYEMLSGKPPFNGPVASILSRHITEVPRLTTPSRSDIPSGLSAYIAAALSKPAGDRPSAASFNKALHEIPETNSRDNINQPERRNKRTLYILAPIALLAIGILVPARRGFFNQQLLGREQRDSTTFAVMALSNNTDTPNDEEIVHLLNDVLTNWDGITVVDPQRVRDVEARYKTMTFSQQAREAVRLGASRFVAGTIKSEDSLLHIEARLYNPKLPSQLISHASAWVPRSLIGARAAMATVVDSLLFRGAPPSPFGGDVRGTRSVPARRAFITALNAMRDWDVARADSMFSAAIKYDQGYAQAQLWLAQIRLWTGKPRADWNSLATTALRNPSLLNPGEAALGQAILSLGTGDYVAACEDLRNLTVRYGSNFTALYDYAECLRRDNRVVLNNASATRWSFRTSAWAALKTYRAAFELEPASHKAFGGEAFSRLQSRFYTGFTTFRDGKNDIGETFIGRPKWDHDTLAFVPNPSVTMTTGHDARDASSTALAVRHTREILHEVTQGWVERYPSSPAALESEAVVLEMLNADSAAAMFGRARRALQDDPDYQVHLLVSEVWVRLKQAIPEDTLELKRITAVVDSLLLSNPSISERSAARLASVAALTGRANAAARFSRQSVAGESKTVESRALPLLTFAAMNGPLDSIRANERIVDQAIRNIYSPDQRSAATEQWPARAATIAFPVYQSPLLTQDLALKDYLIDAELSFARGDFAHALHVLDNASLSRSATPPGAWKTEALLPETWMVARLRSAHDAAERLCPMLTDIAWSEPGAFDDIASAGTLPIAMLAYGDLLTQMGLADGKKWYRAVEILWQHADKEMKSKAEARPAVIPRVIGSSSMKAPRSQSCLIGGHE